MIQAISGSPSPIGVTLVEGGINVAVVSQHASRLFFCVFDGEKEVRFELPSRQGDVYFGFVPGVKAGQCYGFRAEGPYDTARGHMFDSSKFLIDPMATQLDRPFSWHLDLAKWGAETSHFAPK